MSLADVLDALDELLSFGEARAGWEFDGHAHLTLVARRSKRPFENSFFFPLSILESAQCKEWENQSKEQFKSLYGRAEGRSDRRTARP